MDIAGRVPFGIETLPNELIDLRWNPRVSADNRVPPPSHLQERAACLPSRIVKFARAGP
jgi:hypothetical protein